MKNNNLKSFQENDSVHVKQQHLSCVSPRIRNEIMERNKRLDSHFNNLSYYNELQSAVNLITDFTSNLTNQMAILASGGHRIILETFDKDELVDYLYDEFNKQNNSLLNDLHEMYESIMLIFTGFANVIKQNVIYNEMEIDKIVDKMF